MRRLFVSVVIAMTFCAPANAEGPLSAEAFEAHTEGRTLLFYSHGRAYGAERYMPGRKVTWSFLDGECQDGYWYPQGEMICFVYEGIEGQQCWTFHAEGGGLRALFDGEETGTELYEAGETEEELFCLGPKVGA
ncbi:hypothetical protein [Aliiruegeria sabulilitoris]|uniref:hypothetical protein n=1 Tax=Aliiruegeria sabulilitoris TaxID=1510458 RepID=UPI000833EEDC|nr:hypothetical protein [Aliiruegeria sabulilitoris]